MLVDLIEIEVPYLVDDVLQKEREKESHCYPSLHLAVVITSHSMHFFHLAEFWKDLPYP